MKLFIYLRRKCTVGTVPTRTALKENYSSNLVDRIDCPAGPQPAARYETTQHKIVMEGNTEWCTQRSLYRSLDEKESSEYEKEVEIFKRRILKKGGDKTTLLFCCLCTDVMNLERAEQKRKISNESCKGGSNLGRI